MVAPPLPGTAQEEGAVEARVGGSHARPPAGAGEAISYVEAGLLAWTSLGARGSLWASLDGATSVSGGEGDWASLAAGVDRTWPIDGGLTLGLGASGRVFAVGGTVPYRAATVEAAPRIVWRIGAVELFVEGRGGVGRSTVGGGTDASGDGAGPGGPPGTPGSLPGPGPEDGTVETTSDLWQAGGDAGLRVSLGAQAIELRAGTRDATAGVHRRAAVSLRGRTGGLSWRAGAGFWETPADDELVGSVRLEVPLGGGWRVGASGGRSRPDPLLGSPAGAQGGVEVRRVLARFGGASGSPLYRVREDGDRARVVFTLAAPGAREVVLLGDFTGWEPVPMERADGRWRVELRVRPGVHHFGFRVDGRWHVPEDAPGRVDDEWGRDNATVVVPE